jgi:hypothetical protein
VARIHNSPAKYISGLLFDYYLSCDRATENAVPLAILSLLSHMKEMPRVLMRRLAEDSKLAQNVQRFFQRAAAPPLYEINQMGLVRAFHESVNETVSGLADSNMRLRMVEELADDPIVGCVRNLNWSSSTILKNVALIEDSWKLKIAEEIQQFVDFGDDLTLEEYFDLYSLIITVIRNMDQLGDAVGRDLIARFDTFMRAHVEAFKRCLEHNISETLYRQVIEQMSEIMLESAPYRKESVYLEGQPAAYKNYYPIIMSSDFLPVKTRAWLAVPELINQHIISKNYVKSNVGDLMSLLSRVDEKIQLDIWKVVRKLALRGVLHRRDLKVHLARFATLLRNEDPSIRRESWYLINGFAEAGLLDEIKTESWFFNLLKSSVGGSEAWNFFEKITLHKLTNETAASDCLEELLKQKDHQLSFKSWNLMTKLVAKGFVAKDILSGNMPYLERLLVEESLNEEYGDEAWRLFEKMIKRSLLDKEAVGRCFAHLLYGEVHRARQTAQVYLRRWVRRGVVDRVWAQSEFGLSIGNVSS